MLKHKKNITVPDGGDTSVVRPSDWNDDHQVTGGFDLPNETVTSPSVDTARLFGHKTCGRTIPAFRNTESIIKDVQTSFANHNIAVWQAVGGSTSLTQIGMAASTGGTATTASVAATDVITATRRLDYLVTTASTTAVAFLAGAASSVNNYFRGSGSLGGFYIALRFGGATGMTNTSHRFYAGLSSGTSNPADSEPNSRSNIIGVGYGSADANWKLMHKTGTNAATEIDLGSSFPRQSVDRSKLYDLILYAPKNGSSVFYEFTDLTTGSVASGEITSNLPATTTFLKWFVAASVGGVSSVVGITAASAYVETDY